MTTTDEEALTALIESSDVETLMLATLEFDVLDVLFFFFLRILITYVVLF